MRLWLLFCIGHLARGGLAAATYYVAESGSDTNGGNQASPWASVQKAADTMHPGDLVVVQPGIYLDRVTTKRSGTQDARITFRAAGLVQNKGFQIDHSHVTVDGFTVTGAPALPYQGALMVGKTSTNVHLLNCNLINLTTNIYPIVFSPGGLLPGQSANNCVASNIVIRNTMGNMLTIYGMNHLVINNVFDTSNGQDALRVWGAGTRITGNAFTNIGGGPNIQPGHPDILQIFGDNGQASYDHLFDNNFVIDCPCQILMTSQDGVPDIRDVTFFNNSFVRVGYQANCSIPGLRWYNNTFYECASGVGIVLGFGISMRSGVVKGRADRAELINNIFFKCGNDPSNTNQGYYTIDTNLVNCVVDNNFICGANYSGKRLGCPPRPFYFCEDHGINGGDPGFVAASILDLRLTESSPLKGAGKLILGFHLPGPVDIGVTRNVASIIWNLRPYPPTNLRVNDTSQ
jgi:hypothetical protein